MKKICAITMARNDMFFLEHWIEYYGKELGKENLFVFLDGEDQEVPHNVGEATVTHCRRVEGQVVTSDKRRINRLTKEAHKLLDRYDIVIGTDADEFLVVDPANGKSLKEYLSHAKISPSLSGLGIDVGQKIGEEQTVNGNRSFLQQRSYGLVSSRYTKPVVIAQKVSWGAGFHRVKGYDFTIDKNLFLFHFGAFDLEMVKARFSDKDRMASGWERHLKKRAKVITLVTDKEAKDGDKFLPIARLFQTLCRPIFAPNKPSMACWRLVIEIPKRFANINI